MARLSLRSSLSKHLGGTQMQFLDRRQSRQPERLAPDHHRERERGAEANAKPEEAKALAACKQILDQADDAEPDAEQRQPGDAGPEQRAPAKSASRR